MASHVHVRSAKFLSIESLKLLAILDKVLMSILMSKNKLINGSAGLNKCEPAGVMLGWFH